MDDELSNLLNNMVITDVSQVYWNKEIKRIVIFTRVDEIFRIVIFNNNSGELERKIAEPIQGWNEWETCSNQNKSEIGQLIRNFNWQIGLNSQEITEKNKKKVNICLFKLRRKIIS
jgi:hypothetical protein